MKKLCKSNNKMIFGVCAGFAEYLNIDPTIIRLLFAFLVFCAGTGILFYLMAAIIMPSSEV